MNNVYVPSRGPADWAPLLAKTRHWKTGYSAKTLAHCWEDASGLPPEIVRLLRPVFGDAALLLAIPEHKVPLPGGGADSQSDVFALVNTGAGVVACAIEGKVDEPFGPTIGEWSIDASPGKRERLAFLCGRLGIREPAPPQVRYQLLHRTVSALIEADRFGSSSAAMIVHSFSPGRLWFDDFAAFAQLLGCEPEEDVLMRTASGGPMPLHIGWASGDQAFLKA